MRIYFFIVLLLTASSVFSQQPEVKNSRTQKPESGSCTAFLLVFPGDYAACPGSNVQFVANMGGQFNAKVWQESTDGGLTWTNIPGTDTIYPIWAPPTDTLRLNNVSLSMNNNKYRICCDCNGYLFYSYPVLLTVIVPPVTITTQPTNQTVCEGKPANFSINVNGGSLSYQWQLSTNGGVTFGDIQNAVSSSLQLTSVTPGMNGYKYRCHLSSSCSPSINSDAATLTVSALPPLGADTCKSISCITCSTDISGLYNTIQYPVVAWTPADPANATLGFYRLIVNNGGSCSDTALVSVFNNTDNIIRTCFNGRISITSNLTGATYQWQKRTVNNNAYPWANVTAGGMINPSGINSLTLILPPIAYNYGNQFRCIVNGTDTSQVTTVKISSLWTGAADNNWNNPLNWACGTVPDPNFTDVFIYGGLSRYPLVNANVSCRSLTVMPGATVNVSSGFKITLTGTGQ